MKFTKFLIFGLFFFFFSGAVFSQSLKYSAAESLFNDEQIKVLERADKYTGMADKLIAQADDIEAKYEKLKSKKKKKYDKKTWEAKKHNIGAEKRYLKAYSDAVTVYSEIIVAAVFYEDYDKTEANSLNNEAEDLISNAEKKMSSYNKSVNDNKALKKMSASSLNSAINSARNMRESAYDKQKEAVDLVLAQGRKKEENERDDRAWQNAQSINTIASYQDYIDNFPSGKSVNKARQMIRQLQAEEENNKQPVVSGYIFMVQIAASKNSLSNYVLSGIYNNTSEISKVYTDYYYKYRVGNFTNYKDAATRRDQLTGSTVPDAFIVVFDENGNQIEVTDEMKY